MNFQSVLCSNYEMIFAHSQGGSTIFDEPDTNQRIKVNLYSFIDITRTQHEISGIRLRGLTYLIK
jgi:hypothetical protein